MHSLSIILGPRTTLGQTLSSLQDPSEIIVLVPRSVEESNWLEQHYPWFIQYRPWDASATLPDACGPVRILFCAANPAKPDLLRFGGRRTPGRLSDTDARFNAYKTDTVSNPEPATSQDNAADSQELSGDLAVVRQFFSMYRNHRIHLVFGSNAPATLPLTRSIALLSIESALDHLCHEHGNTVLSVLHAGELVDTHTGSPSHSLFATSLTNFAHLMITQARSNAPMNMTIGLDARWMALKVDIQQKFAARRTAHLCIPAFGDQAKLSTHQDDTKNNTAYPTAVIGHI